MAYDTTSYGLDGHEKSFAKPIMMLLLMFGGMAPAMLFWYIQQFFLDIKERDVVPWKTIAILVIPCLCDLLCTLLLLAAQVYLTASLWQMMRGTVIIITAVLKSSVLKISLKRHMWLGVCIIFIAMLIAASPTMILSPPSSDGLTPEDAGYKDPRIGILLVIIGCIAQGFQCKSM